MVFADSAGSDLPAPRIFAELSKASNVFNVLVVCLKLAGL